jgi:Siphovirus Gp157
MSIRLYEIPVEAREIEAALSEGFGELTPELEERISTFMALGKDKIESAAIVVKSLEADAIECKSESNRLYARAQGLERAADRLKALMLTAVDGGFGGKVKTVKFTIWGQPSAKTTLFALKPDADIYAVAAESPEFVRMGQPELKLDALHKAHKNKEKLPDAIAVEEKDGKRYLRIK